MNKALRTGLLLIISTSSASACTSLLGGFDFDGKTASTTGAGGAGGMMMTTSTSASSTTGSGGSGPSSGSGGSGGMPMNPAAPALGVQIDRFGRPAINTALNHVFDVDPAKGQAKDTYNQQSDRTTWAANRTEFAKNMAVFDGLDTFCGNQFLVGQMPVAGRYNSLAGALADDRVYVDLSAAECTTYLAVEASATGLLQNMDCGGRKLDYDVIDATYSILTIGALTGVGDGIPADVDTKGSTFPYLAAPH